MRRGGRLLIFLGILLAFVAFIGIVLLMRRTPQEVVVPEVPTQQVVVAAVDIPARAKLAAEDVTVKEMPVNMVPPLAMTEVLSATDRIALTDIYAGQILLQSMVSGPGTNADLIPALSVPEGMVAMAVPINELSGVGEALRVGDRVDIVVSLRVLDWDAQGNESKPEYSAQMTLQNIEILHLGSWAPPVVDEVTEEGASSGLIGAGGGRAGGTTCEPLNVAIVLVEPQDALVLKYVLDDKLEYGRETFTFVLRGVEDEEIYSTEAVNQEYMVDRFKFSEPPFIIIED